MTRRWETGTMVIPAPLEVGAIMKRVPRGKLTTINDIRPKTCEEASCKFGCLMTTGIVGWRD